MAETWVTYAVDHGYGVNGDGQHRTFQIDAASIVNHQGWIYANHRTCLDYMTDCRGIVGKSAQCQQEKFRDHTGTPYLQSLRNGNEWWMDHQIKAGRREFASSSTDRQQSAIFNFLCKGE